MNASVVSPNFKTPSILESSLEIQHELLPNTTIAIGTMWTHAVHMASSTAFDLNLQPLPAGTTTYTLCPADAGTPGVPANAANCPGPPTFTAPTLDSALLTDGLLTLNFSQINARISPGLNNYNSLYFQLRRRMT